MTSFNPCRVLVALVYVPDILTPVTSYCFGAIVAYFWRQIYSELAPYLSTFGAKTISGHSTLHLTTQYAFGKSTYIPSPRTEKVYPLMVE